MHNKSRIVFYAMSFLFFPGIVLIGNIDRTNSLWLMVSYVSLFGIYLFIWKSENTERLYLLGILARLSLFFSLPLLSDDLYRFLWDGILLKNEIHPFAELPGYYLDKDIPRLSEKLFGLLNSPNYFSIYPPINQGIFLLATSLSNNWLVSAGVMRLVFLIADVGTYHYQKKWLKAKGMNKNLSLLYFLNPLVILEGVGNLHFEGLVVFFISFSIYHFSKDHTKKSALGLGLAIGTKLLPLIFLPYFFFKDLVRKKLKFTLVTLLVSFLTLFPLFSQDFTEGMRTSLSLYFRDFEFNASIYFLAREIGFAVTGYNEIGIIGPFLSLISFLFIITISYIGFRKHWGPEKVLLFVLSSYLLLSTTVHPWYILPLIALGLMSGYIYPIIWSLLIFITYMGYTVNDYFLLMAWVGAEYFIVLLAFIFNNQLKKWLIIS